MARNKRLPQHCFATNFMSRTLRDQSLYELPEFFDQSVVFALSRASRLGLPVCFLRTLCIGLCSAQRFHAEGGAQTCRVGCPDEPDSFTLQRMSSAVQLFPSVWRQDTVLPRRGRLLRDLITQVFLRSLRYGIVVTGVMPIIGVFIIVHWYGKLPPVTSLLLDLNVFLQVLLCWDSSVDYRRQGYTNRRQGSDDLWR